MLQVEDQCFLWTYNLKGHYDPLSEFGGDQFAILEGHKKNKNKITTVAKTCHNSYVDGVYQAGSIFHSHRG